MIAFPNCKINLGLNIISKRSDGYHDLETVFYPLPLYDVLEIIAADKGGMSFKCSGLHIDSRVGDNLCMKAYHLLKNDYPNILPVQMHLYKNIPSGAGLGGGSADAVFTVQLLNRKFNLNISQDGLEKYALKLGSDCPFFLMNAPCLGSGRGEILKPVILDLSAYKIVLINPGIHVPTAKAFTRLIPTLPQKKIKDIIQQPVESWAKELSNDFEVSVFKEFPEIRKIKESLYESGAIYASMSGSGSSVYAMFKQENITLPKFPSTYLISELRGKA